MESQTEVGAGLTSPEEVEEVGKGEPVVGTMVMTIALILDPLDPASMDIPTTNEHTFYFLL